MSLFEFRNCRILECGPDEYHGLPQLSQSALKQYWRDPDLFFANREGRWRRGTTASMEFGKRLEAYLWDGDLPCWIVPNSVLSQSRRGDTVVYSKRGAAWEAWKADFLTTHSEADLELVYRESEAAQHLEPFVVAKQNIENHKYANIILDGSSGEKHRRYVFEIWLPGDDGEMEHAFDGRCELDIVSDAGLLADLKTSVDERRDAFGSSVFKFSYHWQALWYSLAHRAYSGDGELLPFVFVVVRNSAPWSVETYTLSQDWLDIARQEIYEALIDLRDGRRHSKTHGQIVKLDVPGWIKRQFDL